MNNLIAKLFLDSRDFSGNLNKATGDLRKFKMGCDTAGKGVTSFANGLGINIGQLTKFGSVVGAAALAAEGFKTMMEKNDAIGDKYRYTMQNVNDQMDSFWKSVGSGNFSNFISNWDRVNELSEQYSRAIDDVGTYIPIINAQLQVSQTRYNGLVAIASDVLRSERERKGALAAATAELQKQYALKKSILELEGKQARARFQMEFTQRGGKGTMGDWSGRKLLQVDKNGKFNYQNTLEKLKGAADMYDVFQQQNSKGMNGTTLYNGKQYTKQQRDAFLKSQKHNREVYGNLKALDDVVQNDSQVVADYVRVLESGEELNTFMNEQTKQLDRIFKRIGSGSGGGGGHSGRGGSRGGRNHRGGGSNNNTAPTYEKDSIADYDAQIQKLENDLKTQNLTLEKRKEILQKIAKLQDVRKQLAKPRESILDPIVTDLSKSLLNGADTNISGVDSEALNKIREDTNNYIDTLYEGKRAIAEFMDAASGGALSTAENFQHLWENADSSQKAVLALGAAANVTAELSNGLSSAAKNGEAWAAAAKAAEIASKSFAAAEATIAAVEAIKSAAELPFPANIIGIATASASVLSALFGVMGAFADGGIVGGQDYHGDKRTVRVNSGEMILNQRQQTNLFNMINSGGLKSSGGGQVEFKIKGRELVGVLNNFNNKTSKVL